MILNVPDAILTSWQRESTNLMLTASFCSVCWSFKALSSESRVLPLRWLSEYDMAFVVQ